jgi:signal transduction histidine kinase
VKTDFISTAAHQLRTPLTGIRWALEALEKDDLTEGQRQMVADAINKSKDLVAIVGMLLDISSIESGKHKYNFQPLSLQNLVALVVNDFKHLSDECGIHLAYQIPQQGLPNVRADHEQIKWVLNNLVENAIRYTPKGGTVNVSVVTAPKRVQVLVRDTGIGISAKDRNNIFERFYRADNAVAKENKGNGLGLYIARTIATDHGGDLNFSANEGSPGTTFTLSLPLA